MKALKNGAIEEIKSTTEKAVDESSQIKADKAKAYPKLFKTTKMLN